MYNDYMYAVQRDDEYLAHYGIKGMKWGVRKAVESGNSRALGRAYRKASRKLARLEKRANNGKKYARRAALLGAGAAAAGGLAAVGTTGVSRAMKDVGRTGRQAMLGASQVMGRAGNAIENYGLTRGGNRKLKKLARQTGFGMQKAGNASREFSNKFSRKLSTGAEGLNAWGRSNSIGNALSKANRANLGKAGLAVSKAGGNKKVADAMLKAHQANGKLAGVSNNTYARIAAGAVGAGLAGAAGYNAYRAATTKRAARKAQEWRNEMNKAFAGTQYANGGGRKRRRRR